MNINGYRRTTTTYIKRRLDAGEKFDGFCVGSKVSPTNFFDGWGLASPVQAETVEQFERIANAAYYYNASTRAELGGLVWYRKLEGNDA